MQLYTREKKLLENIKILKQNHNYTKAAEFLGEMIMIEEILGNQAEAKSYRQEQIDTAVKGLNYLKEQYEIESKQAAISGDYSKSLKLYKESQEISQNLKIYLESQESSISDEEVISETIETPTKAIEAPVEIVGSPDLTEELDIVYTCINDLITKYFDEIGIKYYSFPSIYTSTQIRIHGLILNDDKYLIEEMNLSLKENVKAIQFLFSEDISIKNIIKLYKDIQREDIALIIIGINWPTNNNSLTLKIPPNKNIKYPYNLRIYHYESFCESIGLIGDYAVAFKEIIDFYNNANLDVLRIYHESSNVNIHGTEELFNDLKEKRLIKDSLEEYFLS